MNYRGDYKQIKNLHTCFKVRVKRIHLVLNLQIQFQALHCFYFLLINQNLGVSLHAPKSNYQSQKQPILPPGYLYVYIYIYIHIIY